MDIPDFKWPEESTKSLFNIERIPKKEYSSESFIFYNFKFQIERVSMFTYSFQNHRIINKKLKRKVQYKLKKCFNCKKCKNKRKKFENLNLEITNKLFYFFQKLTKRYF